MCANSSSPVWNLLCVCLPDSVCLYCSSTMNRNYFTILESLLTLTFVQPIMVSSFCPVLINQMRCLFNSNLFLLFLFNLKLYVCPKSHSYQSWCKFECTLVILFFTLQCPLIDGRSVLCSYRQMASVLLICIWKVCKVYTIYILMKGTILVIHIQRFCFHH